MSEVRATVLVAAAVVVKGDEVLLTQRLAGAHLAGKWEFPGGKVEPGEDPVDAVVRECREELGVDLEVGDILEVTFHAYPEKSVLLLFYRCRLRDEAAEIRHLGVADHVWVRRGGFGAYDLPPADGPVVAKVESLLAPG